MFEDPLPTDITKRKRNKKPEPIDPFENAGASKARENPLDSEPMWRLHRQCMSYYLIELERQGPNRIDQAVDDDCYDGIQWSEEDAAILEERGQMALVFNIVATSINWVLGTEKRGRADFKILPRTKEDGKPAERKTELLKYLSDVNRTPFHRSRAFEDAAKVGLGWLEDGIQEEDDGEPIYSRYESWRNVLADSSATEMDLSDARYIIRAKWVDLDIACAIFKGRDAVLNAAAQAGVGPLTVDDYGDYAMDSAEQDQVAAVGRETITNQRQRVRIIECWYRAPVQAERMRGGMFSGELYDQYSAGHVSQIEGGKAEKVSKLTMRMHVALMTVTGMLYQGVSPYRHNGFPLTPVWGFRRGRDGLPYGLIRQIRDIQMDINKRASKALHILSNNKVIMDKGAVDDIEDLRDEVARPDGIIVKKPGAMLEINADKDLAQWQVELMSRNIQMIQQVSGITDENLGRKTNAVSGIAIERRQQQGSMATTGLFDNLRLASQIQGEKQLSLVEQFMDKQKQFRITNKRGGADFVTINDGLPENDIVRSKADFVISEADWRASMREAAVAELLEVCQKLPPEIVMLMLDLLVENMDIPNRDEIVKRIREATGAKDPDADPNAQPSPEDQAKAQQQAQQQQFAQAQQELALRGAAAGIAKTEADAKKSLAAAEQIVGQLVGSNVKSQRDALEVARESIVTPGAVPIADYVLGQSGFKSQTDREDEARITMQAAQEQQAQQQAAAEQAAQQQQQPQPAAPGQVPPDQQQQGPQP